MRRKRRGPALGRRRRSGRAWIAGLALLVVLGVNGIAWMQAWAMTHYAAGGPPLPRLETMPLGEKVWTVATGVRVPRPANTATPRDAGLPYTDVRIPTPDGGSIAAWFAPHAASAGVVLLFPPYAASKESLLAPARAFHDLGYDALLVDYRGVGDSTGSDTTLGEREGADVALAVAYARRAWPDRPIVLYGVSLGSAAVLHAVAHAGVQPAAVILESPFDRLINTVRNRFVALGVPPSPGAELVVFWGGIQHGLDGFARNPVDEAPAVTCPALLLHGDQDTRATPAEAAAVFAALAGPKREVRVPGAAHELLIDADPALWKRSVAAFLTALPSR